MDRIAFIKLGLTLAATEAWLSGCADDNDGGRASGGAGIAGSGENPKAGSGAVAGEPATGGAGGGRAGQPAGASGGGAVTGECTTDANLVQTSMESHDHLPLTSPITAGELNAGAPNEFAVALEQNHTHTLTFTEVDFAMLRAGMTLVKLSSTMMGHTHTYSIKCV